jgi:hypothetical protein
LSQDHRNSKDFEAARDELFGHIHRCGVLSATEDQQQDWMKDTVDFLGERYPSLSADQLDELRTVGTRFCLPVIAHGKGHDALTRDETETEQRTEESEGAAVA